MAKTREQIRDAIHLNTGRGVEKADLINSLCNEALQLAVRTNAFRDSISKHEYDLVEDSYSLDISDITNLTHVITAIMLQQSGDSYTKLTMKDKIWWDRSIIDPASNQKGWPKYIHRDTSTIYFDRPVESNLKLRLSVSSETLFEDDIAECPIAVLDTFVTHYATALVFLSLENMESYNYWKSLALGRKWDEGVIGGSLKHAVMSDNYDLAEEFSAEPHDASQGTQATSILNLNEDHDDYGNVRSWY